jgi:hypothetical protein
LDSPGRLGDLVPGVTLHGKHGVGLGLLAE